jgi:hypothetical protein
MKKISMPLLPIINIDINKKMINFAGKIFRYLK